MSDDVAALACLLTVLTLLAEPKGDATEAQHDDTEVEGAADRDQDGLEGPLDEFSDGGEEILKVHALALLVRK